MTSKTGALSDRAAGPYKELVDALHRNQLCCAARVKRTPACRVRSAILDEVIAYGTLCYGSLIVDSPPVGVRLGDGFISELLAASLSFRQL